MAKFYFSRPIDNGPTAAVVDQDGDLEVTRRRCVVNAKDFLLIEHSQSTVLQLVGLQVWRGALLINDYILHNRGQFLGKNLLELGSGVGLSSILAALYCATVCCTDLDIGGLLELIRANVKLNNHLPMKANVVVDEFDFMNRNWSDELKARIRNTDFIIAADVIYDDTITEAFVATIGQLFEHSKPSMEMLVALEKRFVFTIADMDSVAPCFEHFLRVFNTALRSRLRIDFIPMTEFEQYFEYDRVKQLILMKITKL